MSTIVRLEGIKKDGTHFYLDFSIDEEIIYLNKMKLAQVDLTPLIECKRLLELKINQNYFSRLYLTPLSYCRDLERLDLSDNRLVSVDLRPLASCTQLREVFLDKNLFLSVDLTPLTQCKSLEYIHIDSFVELNISVDYQEQFLPPALETIKENIHWIESRVPNQKAKHSTEKKQISSENVYKTPLSLESKIKIKQDSLSLEGRRVDGLIFEKNVSANEKIINLFNENLSQIDLTPLLECRQLHTLSLHKNQLIQVDLSPLTNCEKLKVLYLSNNQLSHVDLSPLAQCIQLQELWLTKNQLKQVDLSPLNNCPKLRVLNFDKSVEVNASIAFQTQTLPPALEEIKDEISWIDYQQEEKMTVEEEIMGDEKEEKIIITGEKTDGSPFIREVFPKVSILNLTFKNLKLVDLTSLAQCARLQRLNLSNNQLSQLDLTPLAQCTQLQRLSLGNNQLLRLDLTPLAQCTQLQRLSLGNNQLTGVELSSLSQCTQLQRLNLGNNPLKQVSLTPLALCSKLQRLSLDKTVERLVQKDLQTQTLPPALERIREKIIWIEHVSTVHVTPAPLSISAKEQEFQAKQPLVPKLIEPVRIKKVLLKGVSLDGTRLSKGLKNNEVKISWNYQELVQVELTPLSQCTQLQRLDLSNNQLSQLDLTPLAQCTQLQRLSLGNNQLLRLDLTPLAQCIQLQRFSLSNNQLKQVDLTPLVQCVKLRKIKLDNSVKMNLSANLQTQTLPPAFKKIRKKLNWIKHKPIPSTLTESITLGGINTDGSPFSTEVLPEEEILSLTYKKLKLVDLTPLSSCSQILTLWLYRNQLEEVDLKPLAQCTQLQKISLSNNQLREVDLTPLSQCSQLQRLYIHYNLLPKLDLRPLSHSSQLQQLNLSHNQLREVDLTPLSRLKRLQQLDISHNQLAEVDLTPLSQCSRLQQLNLSHNQLVEVNLTPLTQCRQLRVLRMDDSVRIIVSRNLQIQSLPPAFEFICKKLPKAIKERFYQEKEITSEQIKQGLLGTYLEKGGRYPFRKQKNAIAKLLNIKTSVLTEIHEKLHREGFLSLIDSSPREWILSEKGRFFLQNSIEDSTTLAHEELIEKFEHNILLKLKKFYTSRKSFYFYNERLLREEFANLRYSSCEASEFYREYYAEISDVLTTIAEHKMINKILEGIHGLFNVKKSNDIWEIEGRNVLIKLVPFQPNSSYSLSFDPEVIDSYTSKANDLYLLIFLSTTQLFVLIPPIDVKRIFNSEVISKVDKRFSPTGKLYLLSLFPGLDRLNLQIGEKSLVANKFINTSDIPVLSKLTAISAYNAIKILFFAGSLNT